MSTSPLRPWLRSARLGNLQIPHQNLIRLRIRIMRGSKRSSNTCDGICIGGGCFNSEKRGDVKRDDGGREGARIGGLARERQHGGGGTRCHCGAAGAHHSVLRRRGVAVQKLHHVARIAFGQSLKVGDQFQQRLVSFVAEPRRYLYLQNAKIRQ